MRWSVIPSPLQDYCRNYSRRCNRKCRTAVFIIDNWCRQTSPVWYSISRRFRKMIWLSIVWMSHAQAIMACWQHYCCARCLMVCCRSNWRTSGQRLPEMGSLLKQVNQLLRQANLPGQFPLLVGYYHSGLKNLILVSAGLNGTLNTGEHQIQISNGVPLGTLGDAYLNQISQRCTSWQCQIWGLAVVYA